MEMSSVMPTLNERWNAFWYRKHNRKRGLSNNPSKLISLGVALFCALMTVIGLVLTIQTLGTDQFTTNLCGVIVFVILTGFFLGRLFDTIKREKQTRKDALNHSKDT